MKKEKMLYQVYRKYYLDAEDIENSFEEDWEFAGSTYAVSEKQAINNVRNNPYNKHKDKFKHNGERWFKNE